LIDSGVGVSGIGHDEYAGVLHVLHLLEPLNGLVNQCLLVLYGHVVRRLQSQPLLGVTAPPRAQVQYAREVPELLPIVILVYEDSFDEVVELPEHEDLRELLELGAALLLLVVIVDLLPAHQNLHFLTQFKLL